MPEYGKPKPQTLEEFFAYKGIKKLKLYELSGVSKASWIRREADWRSLQLGELIDLAKGLGVEEAEFFAMALRSIELQKDSEMEMKRTNGQ